MVSTLSIQSLEKLTHILQLKKDESFERYINDWPIAEYLKEQFRNQRSYNNCRALAHAAAEHNSMESLEGEGNKGDEANEGNEGDVSNEGDASNKGDEGDAGNASNDEDLWKSAA